MPRLSSQSHVNNAFHLYDVAHGNLVRMRNQLFPVGTVVRSRIEPDYIVTVIAGSLYADQINTDRGHMSWRFLEKVS